MKIYPEHKASSQNITCPFGGKQLFMTKNQAKVALREMKKYATDTLFLRVYQCPKCSFFHIGNDKYAR